MVLVGWQGDVHVVKIHSLQPAAVTAGEFAAGVVNEEMAHGLAGGGEEMGAIFEGRIVASDEAQPDLMHQGGGLERVTRRAVRHLIRRELAQFSINQRQQLIGGLRVAALDGIKYAGNVADGRKDTRFCRRRERIVRHRRGSYGSAVIATRNGRGPGGLERKSRLAMVSAG